MKKNTKRKLKKFAGNVGRGAGMALDWLSKRRLEMNTDSGGFDLMGDGGKRKKGRRSVAGGGDFDLMTGRQR